MKNEFDNEVKYKLYRSVNEILHPTISKKNISDYRITVSEDVLPIRVYYPKKISDLEKVIIYIHGDGAVSECSGQYSDICKKITKNLDMLVIAIEYQKVKNDYKKMYQDIIDTIKYLYDRFELNNIKHENIILMGDSTGANIIAYIHSLKKDIIKIDKEILFYPVLNFNFLHTKYPSWNKYQGFNINLKTRLKRYYNYITLDDDSSYLDFTNNLDKEKVPNTLIIIGNVDCLKDEVIEYYVQNNDDNNKYLEIPFLAHGFLKKMDKDVEKYIFEEVKEFIEQ